jgi:hypothetical protein
MNCDRCRDALGDYVDGTLTGEVRRSVEEHLQACSTCAMLADDLARVSRLASSLDRLQPPPAVWTRVAQEARLPGYTGSARATRLRRTWPIWVTAAACLLAAFTLGYLVPRRSAERSAGTVAHTGTPAAGVSVAAHPELKTVATELQLAEQHYENAISGLEKLANDREVLDPQVAEALQKNLLVIDQAIAESRTALRQQPANEQAQQSLFDAFRTKVALLQDTIALINEMRKGNQAGAARIAEGLNKS